MAKVSSFIPKKGVNRALESLKDSKKVIQNKAMDSKVVQQGIKNVRKEMQETASKAMPVQDVINMNTGVTKPRKANGRRATKSARESAHVFNQTNNKNIITNGIQAENDRVGKAIDHMRNNRLANEIGEGYGKGRGNGNKANRRIEEMRSNRSNGINHRQDLELYNSKKEIMNTQMNKALDSGNADLALRIEDEMNNLKRPTAPSPVSENKNFNQRKAERTARNQEQQSIAQERRKNRQLAGEIGSNQDVRSNVKIQTEASPSGGNASANKLGSMANRENFVYNMAAMGVGGGLVLNMANNKGQQSNQQLYGQ